MRLFVKLLLCLILAFALAGYMAIPANPEVKFWHGVDQRRDREIAETRKLHPGQPIIFFTGGSSCAFSIDPKIIEEKCGLPAFNLGLPVSAGSPYLLHQALEKTQQGDILVICLEPDLLTYPEKSGPSQFSFAMAASAGRMSGAAGGASFNHPMSLRETLNLTRPGPGYLAVWLAKTATGKGYRYEEQDIRYHGRIETRKTNPDLPRVGKKSVDQLCPSGRELLTTFSPAAARKGVRLLYSMPWMLTTDDAAEYNRAANLKILDSISTVISAIDDGHQGVSIDPANFSDSGLHLTATGSRLRSIALANAVHHRLNHPVSEQN